MGSYRPRPCVSCDTYAPVCLPATRSLRNGKHEEYDEPWGYSDDEEPSSEEESESTDSESDDDEPTAKL